MTALPNNVQDYRYRASQWAQDVAEAEALGITPPRPPMKHRAMAVRLLEQALRNMSKGGAIDLSVALDDTLTLTITRWHGALAAFVEDALLTVADACGEAACIALLERNVEYDDLRAALAELQAREWSADADADAELYAGWCADMYNGL